MRPTTRLPTTNARCLPQTKPNEPQIMLVGHQTIDASKATIRADCGCRDPAAHRSWWSAHEPWRRQWRQRARRMHSQSQPGEALSATTQATTGATSVYIATFEGSLTSDDVTGPANCRELNGQRKIAYGSSVALTVTNLHSLASSQDWTAGWTRRVPRTRRTCMDYLRVHVLTTHASNRQAGRSTST